MASLDGDLHITLELVIKTNELTTFSHTSPSTHSKVRLQLKLVLTSERVYSKHSKWMRLLLSIYMETLMASGDFR